MHWQEESILLLCLCGLDSGDVLLLLCFVVPSSVWEATWTGQSMISMRMSDFNGDNYISSSQQDIVEFSLLLDLDMIVEGLLVGFLFSLVLEFAL